MADGALQNAIIALVREGGGKVHAASLVVPDHFVEVLSVDVDDPDKSPKEAAEILSWKFAKVFGEPLRPAALAGTRPGRAPTGAGPGARDARGGRRVVGGAVRGRGRPDRLARDGVARGLGARPGGRLRERLRRLGRGPLHHRALLRERPFAS
ncbi:MAG: hypothetical protein IPL89_17210 [Acidobacteria bacterium]|nr:hypothetical protein [Acidobacteriota bacterium]